MRTSRVTGAATLLAFAACSDARDESQGATVAGITITSADGGDDGDDGASGEDDEGGAAGEGGSDGEGGAAGSDDAAAIDLKWDVGWNFDAGSASTCMTDPHEDADGDGWSVAEGDCNDCDPNVNPGAIEVIDLEPDEMGVVPEPADEDCDGLIDNVAPPCDGGFAIDDADAYSAAGAMGLCKTATDAMDWGIVSAQYVRANGTPAVFAQAQHGILFDFGPNVAPREGAQHLVLSTGRARLPGMVDQCGSLTCGGSGLGMAPAGFPQDVPACPGSNVIYDDVALEVTLRAPTNATGYSYNFTFYSFEYPEWVCTAYNDQYLALVEPAPVGSINGNISFDANTNPVSVNIAFFEVCAGCPLGTAELTGTGFDIWDDAGATSWLQTTAPIEGGTEFTIRFAIFDTGDAAWDSTVVLDNFQWIADGGTVAVGTTPEG